MRAVLLSDDGTTVVSTSLVESAEDAVALGLIVSDANVGDTYSGGVFTPRPPRPEPVPEVVTLAQARIALREAGHTAAVEAAIAALPQPDRGRAEDAWAMAPTVSRTSSLVAVMAAALPLTETEVDDLFRAAAAIDL